MSILVEAFSVIIRGDSIIKTFGKRGLFGVDKKKAWEHFKEVCGSEATLCADGDLVRYGFMLSEDALDFINFLESKGLQWHDGYKIIDLCFCSQEGFFIYPEDKEISHEDIRLRELIGEDKSGKESNIMCCYLEGKDPLDCVNPVDWEYEGSLSEKATFIGLNNLSDQYSINTKNELGERVGVKFLRHEDGLEVWLDCTSGKELYAGTSESVKANSEIDELLELEKRGEGEMVLLLDVPRSKAGDQYSQGVFMWDKGDDKPQTSKKFHLAHGGDPEVFDEWIKRKEITCEKE